MAEAAPPRRRPAPVPTASQRRMTLPPSLFADTELELYNDSVASAPPTGKDETPPTVESPGKPAPPPGHAQTPPRRMAPSRSANSATAVPPPYSPVEAAKKIRSSTAPPVPPPKRALPPQLPPLPAPPRPAPLSSAATDEMDAARAKRPLLRPVPAKSLPTPPPRSTARRSSADHASPRTASGSLASANPTLSSLKSSTSAGSGIVDQSGERPGNAVPKRAVSRSQSLTGEIQANSMASVQQTELQRKIDVLQGEVATTRAILSALTIEGARECSETRKVRDKLAMQEAMLDAVMTTAAMEQLKEHQGLLFMQAHENISDALYTLETISKKIATANVVKVDLSMSTDDILFEEFHLMRFELENGTLNYCEEEQTGSVGSIELSQVTRIVKAQLDARVIILQCDRRAVILASRTKKDTMMWVSSFVAVNELIAVVDAAQVRKEIRMRRGSSGSGRINREAIKSDAMVAGCARSDFIPVASMFSQLLAVEFKGNRVLLEAGSLQDCCCWVLLLGSSWDRVVLFQNYTRFATPQALRETLESCWSEIETKFPETELSSTYRPNLAAVARHWLAEVHVTADVNSEREQRFLFKYFCLERLGSGQALTSADPCLPAMSPKASLGWFSMTGFVELPPDAMAGQLAIADFRLFACSGPQDFVNDAWNASGESGLKKIIKLSNIISSIVSFVVLSATDKKARERAYTRWITVANKLHTWNCCNTALSVLAGLSRTAVARLKIHEMLPSKAKARYDKLQSFYSPAKNFSEYRTLVTVEPYAAGSQPFLPVIAVLLKDLTFIEDGNTDFVGETTPETLNWFKIHSKSVQVYHMVRARDVLISAKPNEEQLAGILSFHPPTDDDLYEMSIKVLPVKNKHLVEEVAELKQLRDSLQELLEASDDPAQAVAKSLALISEQRSG